LSKFFYPSDEWRSERKKEGMKGHPFALLLFVALNERKQRMTDNKPFAIRKRTGMNKFIIGAVVLATALSANAVEPAQGLDKPIPSPASLLLDRLKAVADSPRYYWAWTHTLVDPWLQQGDARHAVAKDGGYVPKALSDVELKFDYGKYSGGRRTVINYSDLAAIAGTWHSPESCANSDS
jgi:hypothetical protein